jgi:hypothetical protein
MGSKPKAPDMRFQVEAAKTQEAELAKQRTDIEAKQVDTSRENTEKLIRLRRRQGGRMGERQKIYTPFTPTPPQPKFSPRSGTTEFEYNPNGTIKPISR